jgi:hypothetical protein
VDETLSIAGNTKSQLGFSREFLVKSKWMSVLPGISSFLLHEKTAIHTNRNIVAGTVILLMVTGVGWVL